MGGLLGDVKDVVSILKDVVSLASSVLRLGETWYHASEALAEFKRSEVELKSTYEFWQSRAQNYGLSSDTVLRSSLERAKKQLQDEEARLQKLDRGCGFLWLWLRVSSETDFPAQLGKTFADLDKTIICKWKNDEDAEDALRKRADFLARSPTFAFKKDPRYVRLPIIETEVKNALNNKGNGDEAVGIVLLHGIAGSGKSSMARNLALDYRELATFVVDPCASNSTNGCQFDNIFYLECGPKADWKAKQVELFGMLDWKSSDAEKEKYKDSTNVKPVLKQRLKDSRSLVIFDDVWEGSFLKNMFDVCGQHMKILVTSQEQFVCGAASIEKIKSISMDQITREDSLKILKFHAGFDDRESVPRAVQECMEDLVTKVCGHPHALASIAVAIDQAHKDEEYQWENAIREHDKYLNDPLPEDGCYPVHGVHYKRSLAEAIQMKFNRLGEEERKLLVLVVMLESRSGPSIPQEVLQLFHAEILASDKSEGIRSCDSFFKARKRLENLQCIKISEYQHDVSLYPWHGSYGEQCTRWWKFGKKRLSWTIHSLDEQFIQERMQKDIDSLFETIQHLPNKRQGLEVEPQINVIKVLGQLFCKHDLQRQIGIPWYSPSEYNYFIPIIALMAKNVGKSWNKASQRSSDQIFLSCVTKRMIHHDAAKELLNSPMSRQELWTLMRCFTWDTEGSIHEDVIVGVLEMFGNLKSSLDSSVVESLNPDQWNALLVFVSRPELSPARSCIFRMKKFVLGLMDMITSPSCPPGRRHLSALVLSYFVPLMYDERSANGEGGFANISKIIGSLVHSVQEINDKKVLEEAIRALYALADYSKRNLDVREKMVNVGFHQLVDIFGREGDEDLQGLIFKILRTFLLDSSVGPYHNGLQISASAIADLGSYLTRKVAARESDEIGGWSVIDHLKLLMRIDPAGAKSLVLQSCVTLEARGKFLATWGQDRDAVHDFEKARQLDPTGFTSHEILVDARRRLKDWEGLVKDYDHEIWRIGEGEYRDGYLSYLGYLYEKRGSAKHMMGDLPGALQDLEKSLQLYPKYWTVFRRGHVKFLMGDKEGARVDIEEAASRLGFDAKDEDLFYQERGVAKRMIGDLPGALKDLDKSLNIGPNDYEVLKQRGYLKFLMGDEKGARADAKEALQFKPSGEDEPGYDHDNCLGTSVVEFLGFRP